MSTEEILTQILETLTSCSWETPQDLLNSANTILYPLKQKEEIVHYYFSVKEEESEVFLTIFLQKDESSPQESWELSISKDSEQE